MALTRAVTDFKDSVKAATTTDITLTGGAPNTLDSISLSLADSILVKAQSNPTENGLYRVTNLGTGSNGTWTRRSDFNSSSQVNAGALIFVEQGAINGNVFYYLPGGIGTVTVGSTNLNFSNLYATIQTQIDDSIIATILPTYAGNVSASNVNVSTGIYSSNYYFANGTPFTSSNYGNTEVSSYLETYTSNIGAGNINVTSGIYSANYYFANGDPFTSSNYGNTEVGSYLETYSGNLTADNITVNGNFTVVNYEYVNTTEFANLQTATTVNAQTIGNTGATLIGNINGTVWGPLNGTIGDTIANSGVFTTLTATTGYQGNTNGAHNGTVGVTTPNSGAFTTLTASSTLDVSGIANFAETINAATLQASTIGNIGASIIGTHNGPVNGPMNGTIGATTPNTGAFTTLTTSSTANVGNLITSGGVFWPNGSSYSSGSSSTTGNVNPSLYLGNVTVSTTATLIDTLPVNGNTLVRWSVIANDSVSSKYRSGIIDSINDASDVYYNEYAVIKSSNNDNVVVLTSNISAGNINLYGVGDSAAVYVQFERLALGTGSTFGFLNIGAMGPAGPVGPTGSVANTSGYIVTTNTDPSTSTTTGALQVAGGVGILGNLYVGGGINGIIGNGTASSGSFTTLTATTQYDGAVFGPVNGTVGATTANTGKFTTLTATTQYDGAVFGPFNGTVGATTPNTGAFTSVSITGASTANSYTTLYGGQLTGYHTGTIGANIANTGAFTTVTTSANLTVAANASITGNLVVGNISGRISPRVSSTASITSPLAWNSNSFDQYVATAQAGNLTINADAGTPVDGQKILFRFKDSGTARALTFTTGATNAFRAVGVTLPTTTTISKITYVGCIYNAADSRWDAIAVTTEA